MQLRIAAAQLDAVVGDLEGNVARILEALARAEEAGADVCVFPELAITGYPPEDLLLKARFVADNRRALGEVAAASRRCVAVVGFVGDLSAGGLLSAVTGPDKPAVDESDESDEPGEPGEPGALPAGGAVGAGPCTPTGAEARDARWRTRLPHLANAAAVCAGGHVVGVYRKRLLPNYSVFDEERWFTPGEDPPVLYRIGGVAVGVSICEDVWADDGPVAELGRAGAQLVVNLNASPYSLGRRGERLAMLADRVRETGCPILYVNQVGGQDELVFDGASLVVGLDGSLLAAGAQFAEDLVVTDLAVPDRPTTGTVVDVTGPRQAAAPPLAPTAVPAPLDPVAEVYDALVLGTRDYLAKNGFSGAVIGLSGGIDSSLVATVATDALGAAHVHGVAMPSRYSSEGSLSDAELLATRLGVHFEVVPIDAAHRCFSDVLSGPLGAPPSGLPDENLQSRLRGVVLMAISNATGWIVLTTGNKSEMATGYSTLYGDSAGGFAVIKDVPKTLVYELCRYRNARAAAVGRPEPIPATVLDKPPSAELRPGQRDDQSLPPYELLDPVLEAYVERDRTAADLVGDGFDPEIVDRVVRLVDGAEYKRRQMPPGVRITNKAFGRDRRMPITNRYRPPVAIAEVASAVSGGSGGAPGAGEEVPAGEESSASLARSSG